ncbi:hypothetical protein [Shewanella indica]|uniref:hypothetical protein n=1 Tax=Shewanella indica TaxID=768528 RepID=UPI0030052C16
MTDALEYEYFIRNAFQMKGNSIERWGDPAQLADTDAFSDSNINGVKAATAYAIESYNTAIQNNDGSENITDDESAALQNYTSQVFAANTIADVQAIINDYNDKAIKVHSEKIKKYKS